MKLSSKIRKTAKLAGVDLRTKAGKQFVERSKAARKGWKKRRQESRSHLHVLILAISYPFQGGYFSFVGRRLKNGEFSEGEKQAFRSRVERKLRASGILKNHKAPLWFDINKVTNEQVDVREGKLLKLPKGAVAHEEFEDERTGETKNFNKYKKSKSSRKAK